MWTPQQLHDDKDFFISEIKASLPLRPSIVMHYLFVPPEGTDRTVGGPIVSVQRHYTMHYISSSKNVISFASRPFDALHSGVFFSRAEAAGYGDVMRAQGFSFDAEGVVAAREALSLEIERAREMGDTLAMHTSMLSLALLSGVNGDKSMAKRATTDISRVTKSAAARHRSLRQMCDAVRDIVGVLIGWASLTVPILKWEGDLSENSDSEQDTSFHQDRVGDGGRPRYHYHSRLAMDLFQSWLRTAHRVFWGLRGQLLLYLDADSHSDVMVVKDRVRGWIAEVSSVGSMGLRLPTLRWHNKSRIVTEGKDKFLDAAVTVDRCLSSLSGWLHCLDLSMAWDAARVCDDVHSHHVAEMYSGGGGAQAGSRTNRRGSNGTGSDMQTGGCGSMILPTAVTLLQTQRRCLNDAAIAAAVRKAMVPAQDGKGRGARAAKAAAAAAAEVAKSTRYQPAPLTPDSTAYPHGINARLLVLDTLREDNVPEALAHEIALIQYATENRIDEYLHDVIHELTTSVCMPNPFPVLTDALAPKSMKQLLWRRADFDEAVPPAALTLWGKKGDRTVDSHGHCALFVARGSRPNVAVFGSRPALAGVDVDAVLVLLDMLPPVELWAQEGAGSKHGGSGGVESGDSIDLGIYEPTRQCGPYVHHATPDELTVTASCTYDFQVSTGETPMEHFARLAAKCAAAAVRAPTLVVVDLCFRISIGETLELLVDDTKFDGHYSPSQLIHAHGEVERGLIRASPHEIVLRAFTKRLASSEGGVLIPLTIRFVFFSDHEEGGGCDEGAVAALLYDCVYSSGGAASSVVIRHSTLLESGLPDRHLQRLSVSALRYADRKEYLKAYRLLLRLRSLQPIASGHQMDTVVESGASVGSPNKVPNPDGIPGVHPGFAATETRDIAVASEIVRMLRGPAGRLDHTRRLVEVLRRVLSGSEVTVEASPLFKASTVRQHAEHTVRYLLGTLAEQHPSRFEGAVESVKLRARLLLDRVREIGSSTAGNAGSGGVKRVGENAARINWSDAGEDKGKRDAAYELTLDVLAILEIIQLAVEADVHRCCPEVECAFESLRMAQQQGSREEC